MQEWDLVRPCPLHRVHEVQPGSSTLMCSAMRGVILTPPLRSSARVWSSKKTLKITSLLQVAHHQHE